MNPILMQAIVDFVLFLNLSGEDVIDLRASVKHLEQLSVTLAGLAPHDRSVFARYVEEVLTSELDGPDRDRRVETLQALIQDLTIEH